MPHTYDYPRPALAVDCVVFGVDHPDPVLKVLLIKRGIEPFLGQWALPGGFVHMEETTDEAARRELEEETHLKLQFLEQLYTFSAVNRDPRERVVSVAYLGLVRPSAVKGGDDAAEARWVPFEHLPPLAFDHAEIVAKAHERLRAKIRREPVGFELLPPKFGIGDLQRLYEAILDHTFDQPNFRKAILHQGILEELDEWEMTGDRRRPPRLYRFDRAAYKRLQKQGFQFSL